MRKQFGSLTFEVPAVKYPMDRPGAVNMGHLNRLSS